MGFNLGFKGLIRLIVDTFYLISYVMQCVLFPAEPSCGRLQSQGKRSKQEVYFCILPMSGPGSSVGIATDYGLDGPGIESRGGGDFPPFQTGPGAHSASCTMGTRSFPGGKVWPVHAADHSPLSSTEVLEE